jgi:hypothetical protein
MTRALTLVVAALCAAAPLAAQWRVSGGLEGTREIVQSRPGAGAAGTRFAGSALGGGVEIARGPVMVRLRYGQGRVTNDTAARDVVHGAASIGYAARSWLTISAGPEARTFIVAGMSDRRWLFWTARARAQGEIFPGRLRSFIEAWYGLSGRLNRPATAARGSGVELGLETRLPRLPLRGRLGYRVQQGRTSGGLKETVEGFSLALETLWGPRP